MVRISTDALYSILLKILLYYSYRIQLQYNVYSDGLLGASRSPDIVDVLQYHSIRDIHVAQQSRGLEFESLSELGLRKLDEGDIEGAVGDLKQAVSRYAGAFLVCGKLNERQFALSQ